MLVFSHSLTGPLTLSGVKVITGVIRSGKPILLEKYIDRIIEHDPKFNIISIDLTNLKFEEFKEYHALNNYIEDRYDRKKENYTLLMMFKCASSLN